MRNAEELYIELQMTTSQQPVHVTMAGYPETCSNKHEAIN
jgi:hypothetical protein